MSELTPDVLSDLRKKAAAATSGPWSATPDPESVDLEAPFLIVLDEKGQRVFEPYDATNEDKAFIASANPAIVLALLDRVASLEKALRHERTWEDL